MSDIRGSGYGASHDWRRGETVYRVTIYQCAGCGEAFGHAYPTEPSIFKAMYRAGVPDLCPATQRTMTTETPTHGT